MSTLTFRIADVEAEQGKKSYSFELKPDWVEEAVLDTEYSAATNIGTVSVDIRLVEQDVVVTGRFKAPLSAICGRCNSRVEFEVASKLSAYICPAASQADLPPELELTPEDLERDYYEGEEVSLDALVRETILLEAPSQPRCEGDCSLDLPEPTEIKRESPLSALLNLKKDLKS